MLVGGNAKAAKDPSLESKRFIQWQVRSLTHGFHTRGDRERGLRGNAEGQRTSGVQKCCSGHDLIHQADAQGLSRWNDVCREDEPKRRGGPNEPRQALRAAVPGDQPKLHLRLAQARGLTGDSKGTGERQFATSAQCEAVDAGDDRLPAAFHLRHDSLTTQGKPFAGGVIGLPEFLDVGPRCERFLAPAGQQNDAHGGVCGQNRDGSLEFREDLEVQRVQHLRPVQSDRSDGPVVGKEQRFERREDDVSFFRHADSAGVAAHDDTIEDMIKGMTVVESVLDGRDFTNLKELFASLGFEAGKGWKDATGEGAAFLAPLGNVEFVTGRMPAVPRILVEVTQLDHVHAVVAKWVGGTEIATVTDVTETHWNSRLFTLKIDALEVGFWQSENPMHGVVPAIEGELSAEGMKFAVITTRWNTVITDRLLQGALDCLRRSGAATADIQVVRVPGAWEIPNAARTIAEAGKVDAIVTLGCLLRGETAHYEAIYNEVSRGIGQSQQDTGVPHAFGVLTCETLEQALDRAGLKAGNKGFEAASAAIEMVNLNRKLKGGN